MKLDEYSQAEAKVNERYPELDIETKLKLINMYLWGKSDGMDYAKEILNEHN